jgi:uncharacterized protein
VGSEVASPLAAQRSRPGPPCEAVSKPGARPDASLDTALDRHVTARTCHQHALHRPATTSLAHKRPDRTPDFETASERARESERLAHVLIPTDGGCGNTGAGGVFLSWEEMAAKADELDLAAMRLSAGEGRGLALDVSIEPLILGSETYTAEPARVTVELDLSRMTGMGYALRLRFVAALEGPCMRCLQPAAPLVEVEAWEVDRPGAGEELSSPYVHEEVLDLAAWTRDAFALAVPVKVLCREDCAGLCPICAADLNAAGPEHLHERAPDPRWAKLGELKLE